MQLVGRDQKLAETSTTIIYDAYLVSRWWWQCNPHHANFIKKSLIVHFLMIGFDSRFDSGFDSRFDPTFGDGGGNAIHTVLILRKNYFCPFSNDQKPEMV